MNLTGIITEYNPLHFGHILHLNKSKEITKSDGIICIISGNFVQRGLPSITDKWSRTKMALDAGVDLIIELPTLFAVSSAESFAFGAVSILNSLNVVNNLCFGSEEGDINLIKEISEILFTEPLEFKNLLKEELSSNSSFPKARANALFKYLSKKNKRNLDKEILLNFLNSSNNILAIEYCKALLALNSPIKPYTIKREVSNYNDLDLSSNKIQSATALRNSIYKKNLISTKEFLPDFSYNILKNKDQFSEANKIFDYIKFKAITSPLEFSNISEATEGLENKVLKEILNSNSLEELTENCKSKRYTYTKISRLLCNIFLGITKDLEPLKKEPPNYIRVLGASTKGFEILKEIKKNSDINIITKVPRDITDPLLALDLKATNLYSLLNPSLKINSDYFISPIIKK
ncbi:MAG: nucleotidyltransferase [Sarcina sp.]